jgi:hypothetical protein
MIDFNLSTLLRETNLSLLFKAFLLKTVEKTKNTLMLTPDSREGIFVLTYINDIGDHITIPVTTTSLHIEMREQEYKPFPTEKKIQIDAYQD